jgi:arylsulfatase A-like enzyme
MKPIALILLSLGIFVSATAAPPNILLLLTEDLGYADIGANGCKDIPTPHIDSLAKNGVRLTDGYATHSVCSPSRAGLMSGRYQHRFGFEHNSGPERFAADNFGLPRSEPTLAERLKPLGYATGMVGKWHIGCKAGLRPHERGFDFHFGFLSGARTYQPGKTDNDPLVRNGKTVTDEKEYLTDAFARKRRRFSTAARTSRSCSMLPSMRSTRRWRLRTDTQGVFRTSPARVAPMPACSRRWTMPSAGCSPKCATSVRRTTR